MIFLHTCDKQVFLDLNKNIEFIGIPTLSSERTVSIAGLIYKINSKKLNFFCFYCNKVVTANEIFFRCSGCNNPYNINIMYKIYNDIYCDKCAEKRKMFLVDNKPEKINLTELE